MSLLLRERLTEEAAAQLRNDGLVDFELQSRIVGAGLHLDTITSDALDMADSDQFELPLS